MHQRACKATSVRHKRRFIRRSAGRFRQRKGRRARSLPLPTAADRASCVAPGSGRRRNDRRPARTRRERDRRAARGCHHNGGLPVADGHRAQRCRRCIRVYFARARHVRPLRPIPRLRSRFGERHLGVCRPSANGRHVFASQNAAQNRSSERPQQLEPRAAGNHE